MIILNSLLIDGFKYEVQFRLVGQDALNGKYPQPITFSYSNVAFCA